jgi:hypothetical protein
MHARNSGTFGAAGDAAKTAFITQNNPREEKVKKTVKPRTRESHLLA